MEKLLNPYDKECMRMAMLKHEQTFREQVYELHRLYQIQKILMKNITNNRQNHVPEHTSTRRQFLDLERPAEEYNAETIAAGGDAMVETVDESELELTLGPSSFYGRMRAPAGEAPLPSDHSGPSFSSSSTGSSHIKRSKTSESHKWRLDMPISSPSLNNSDVVDDQEHLRQDKLKNPPWLFQVLHLNMT